MSVFRELFVELSEQAMLAAHAAVAQAIAPTQEPEPFRRISRFREMIAVLSPDHAISAALAGELGWRGIVSTYQSAESRDVVIVARLRCGHRHHLSIDSAALEFEVRPEGALLSALFRRANERSCYCTPERRS